MTTSDGGMDPVTWAAHFAFGAAAGGLYGTMMGEQPQRPFLSGIAFGLGIWVSHYGLGFPAMDMKCGADRETPNRNLMMIASHVVWGAALGGLYQSPSDRE